MGLLFRKILSFGSQNCGYKQAGNGREGRKWGLGKFLEVKAISGWQR
jgi:acyl-CoA reductase-like NAD-dependent aldehyde dehydrogenase